MMSHRDLFSFLRTFLLIVVVIILFENCSDDPIIEPEQFIMDSSTEKLNSSEGGSFCCTGGFGLNVLPGAIPTLLNGEETEVTFSIETNGDLPYPIPAEFEPVGGGVAHFGPEGMAFELPILITMKVPDDLNINNVIPIVYDYEAGSWRMIPISYSDDESRSIGFNTFELGYVALIRSPLEPRSPWATGGIRNIWDSDPRCVIVPDFGPQTGDRLNIFTINSVEDPVNPEQFINYDVVGQTTFTRRHLVSGSGGLPDCHIGTTMAVLPRATYSVWVTAAWSVGDERRKYTYSIPAIASVSENLSCAPSLFAYQNCTQWTGLEWQDGGEWIEGVPGSVPELTDAGSWPTPTIPACTGEFQATLTWNNGSGDTDLDLHLYGPDGMHVYYSDPVDGEIVLDRDWLHEPGNAEENICTEHISDLPSGSYRLVVNNYAGVTKDFHLRLIRDGNSITYSESVSEGEEITVVEFTIS